MNRNEISTILSEYCLNRDLFPHHLFLSSHSFLNILQAISLPPLLHQNYFHQNQQWPLSNKIRWFILNPPCTGLAVSNALMCLLSLQHHTVFREPLTFLDFCHPHLQLPLTLSPGLPQHSGLGNHFSIHIHCFGDLSLWMWYKCCESKVSFPVR